MKRIVLPRGPALKRGAHTNSEQGMCAMEMADFLDAKRSGRPMEPTARFSDSPECVCPVIAAFMRRWNDELSDADRDRAILALVPLTLDTARPGLGPVRGWMAANWIVRAALPAWLDVVDLSDVAGEIRQLQPVMDVASAFAAERLVGVAATAAAAREAAAPWNPALASTRLRAADALKECNAAMAAVRRGLSSSDVPSILLRSARDAVLDAARAASWSDDQVRRDRAVHAQRDDAGELVRRMCALRGAASPHLTLVK